MKITWTKDRLPTPMFLGFSGGLDNKESTCNDPLEEGMETDSSILGLPCGSAGKESTCNEGDLGSVPGLGRSPGEGKGYPPQYSGLEYSMVSQRVGQD